MSVTKKTRLSIIGMSCAGCVSAVEAALSSVSGVESASVSLAERCATVTGTASNTKLIEALKKHGYDGVVLHNWQDEYDQEQQATAYQRSKWRTLFAGLIGLGLMISDLIGLLPEINQGQTVWLIIGTLTLTIMIVTGGHFYRGAWNSLLAGRANMNTLIALGTGTAWSYSALVILWPEPIPTLAQHVYFDASIMIIALVSLGSLLEAKARSKTSQAIKQLIGLQPRTAFVIRNGQELECPIEQIGVKEIIKIRPGDRIPVDGKLVRGESYIDESMLTGEPMPERKTSGATVYAGTVNKQGSFFMVSSHVGSETVLAGIVAAVRKAQETKPAIGRLVDKVAAIFVPVVILIALCSFVLWNLYGPQPSLSYAVVTAMTVLVIACPCALGLATPISIMVAVGRAAELGILIRNGEALQRTGQVDTVIFDKTGTLTEGKPRVTGVIAFNDADETQLLKIAASIETGSEHPIAKAIIRAAKHRKIRHLPITHFEAIPGQGASATIEEEVYYLGNRSLMDLAGADTRIMDRFAEQQTLAGDTVIYVSQLTNLLGIISITDPVRKEALAAINQLKALKLQIAMLTGDNQQTANSVAKQLGIDHVIAELMPEDKQEQIILMQEQGRVIAMVGDGINDAPALAAADVGIAIGTGTDVAIEAADIALMHNSIQDVTQAIMLSRATLNNIRQNLLGAFLYNSLGIPVAAGVLFPAYGFLLNPMIAAAAMSLSSVTVVGNALRLRSIKLG